MRAFTNSVLASSLLALAPLAAAQIASNCPSSNVCYKLNIPQDTASSGSGDIYFQISAPSSYSWVALGQGNGMVGANMFLIYTNQAGNNVTLSPRTATSHSEPKFNSNAQVQLLDGSGVSNGVMTANVKCSSCSNWGTGTMDFTSSSGGWLYAYLSSGGSLNSDDTNADISMHSSKSTFTWDFSNAKGGNDVNPFTSSSSNSTTSPGNSSTSNPQSGGGSGSGNGKDNTTMKIIAHGILAALAFVILFPSGAIAIRVVPLPGIVWIHAAIQILAYLVFITAVGLGIYVAQHFDALRHTHPILGLFIFSLMFFQPILGLLHHSFFKKYHRRTVWSHAHLWLGRILITLGIINGGLGLDLANKMHMSSKGGIIAYSVIAPIMWLAWVGASIVGERRRKRQLANASDKYNDLSGSTHADHINQDGTEM